MASPLKSYRPRFDLLENRLAPSGSGSSSTSSVVAPIDHSGSGDTGHVATLNAPSGSQSSGSGGQGSGSGGSGGSSGSSGSSGSGGGQYIIVMQTQMVTISGPGYPHIPVLVPIRVSVNNDPATTSPVLAPLQDPTAPTTSLALAPVLASDPVVVAAADAPATE